MSRILDKYEVYTLPLDEIIGINRKWRDGIKTHDTNWPMLFIKYPDYDVNRYIIYNYPELKEQFEWEHLTGNERMARKFSHVKTSAPSTHYTGEYRGYDRDFDPFFDQE